METELVTDASALAPHQGAWDALSVASGLPLTLSSWTLAFHRHLQADEPLRVVLVHEAGVLVGVGPFSVYRWSGPLGFDELRLLGAGAFHRIGPLSAPGREPEVAAALAGALRELSVGSVALEGGDAASAWALRLQAAWPGRVRLRRDSDMVAPTLHLAGGFDAWAARRSPKFRKSVRHARNAVARRGGVLRPITDASELPWALDGFFAAHRARWAHLGHATTLDERAEAAVRDAAPVLLDADRLLLWVVEHEGAVVGAELAVHAGRSVAFWQGGYAPEWARESLGLVLMHAVIEEAARRGVLHVDLGGGDQGYKHRFADDQSPLAWRSLHPVGSSWPVVRARMAPKHVRSGARRRAKPLVLAARRSWTKRRRQP